MMYCEFVEGTGCKDNAHNYEVFKNLEIMYMNSNMSKAEIYEYGKKLVDNSKSEEQIAFEAEINAEIEMHKEQIKQYKGWIEQEKEYMNNWKEYGDKEMVAMYRRSINFYKEEVKAHRDKIAELKWVLE